MSLVVVRASGLVTIQDLGRRGHMHEAVPPGGALVPELLVRANRAAGNAESSPAIEVCGRLVVRADEAISVATDRIACVLAGGKELVVESEPRRASYLAIRGGVDAPLVVGGRGTLLCAGIGALLRSGDTIRAALAPIVPRRPAVVRVIAGPDLDAFAPDVLAILASSPYRVSPASDRVGTRLAGPAIPRVAGYREVSRPMVRGALEVPSDGLPIVLGPEHPTTGGYPLLAVVVTADIGRLFAIRIGGTVRFTQYV